MIIAFVGYWGVGMPASYLLCFPLGLEGIGIWLGLALGLAFASVVLTARFALRERIGLVRGAVPPEPPILALGAAAAK